MTPILQNLDQAWKNKHVALPVLGSAAIEVAKIWLPAYKAQLDETQRALMLYGIIAANGSTPASTSTTPPSPK